MIWTRFGLVWIEKVVGCDGFLACEMVIFSIWTLSWCDSDCYWASRVRVRERWSTVNWKMVKQEKVVKFGKGNREDDDRPPNSKAVAAHLPMVLIESPREGMEIKRPVSERSRSYSSRGFQWYYPHHLTRLSVRDNWVHVGSHHFCDPHLTPPLVSNDLFLIEKCF